MIKETVRSETSVTEPPINGRGVVGSVTNPPFGGVDPSVVLYISVQLVAHVFVCGLQILLSRERDGRHRPLCWQYRRQDAETAASESSSRM